MCVQGHIYLEVSGSGVHMATELQGLVVLPQAMAETASELTCVPAACQHPCAGQLKISSTSQQEQSQRDARDACIPAQRHLQSSTSSPDTAACRARIAHASLNFIPTALPVSIHQLPAAPASMNPTEEQQMVWWPLHGRYPSADVAGGS